MSDINDLPADWAIERALEVGGFVIPVALVKEHQPSYPYIVNVARYIETKEQPPVDPLVEALQAWGECEYGPVEAEALRAAMQARGYAFTKIGEGA